MSCRIDKQQITMTRGDTRKMFFYRKDKLGHIITYKADKLYFTVKESEFDETPIFQKTIADMVFGEDYSYTFTITPEDTNGLEYGDYVYDIEVITDTGAKRTISKGNFKLTWESTWAQNEGDN